MQLGLGWMLDSSEEEQDGVPFEQLAAVFSRIRFPDVPVHILLNYHRQFRALQRFDPDKELLLLAVSSPCVFLRGNRFGALHVQW